MEELSTVWGHFVDFFLIITKVEKFAQLQKYVNACSLDQGCSKSGKKSSFVPINSPIRDLGGKELIGSKVSFKKESASRAENPQHEKEFYAHNVSLIPFVFGLC